MTNASKFDRMIRVSPELHREASIVAVVEGKELRQVMNEALSAYLATKQIEVTISPRRLTDQSASYEATPDK